MDLVRRTHLAIRGIVRTAFAEARRTKRVIVMPDSRPQGELPFFITGVHRSGTTLLRLIVDSHSRIACPPESFFLLPLSKILEDDKAMEGLAAMGFAQDHALQRLRECASYFFEMYTALRGKVRWADKTPSYIDCLDFLEALYGPTCRYVLIYRHGLDAACSIATMPIREVLPHTAACAGDRHAGAARYWATQCQKMIDFQEAHPSRCLELRYEELVQEPEGHLRRMFDFLEESWEPGVLKYYEYPHDKWIGLEDGKASDSRGFKPNIGSYRAQPPEIIERMLQEAGPMLAKLQYDTGYKMSGRTPGA